MAKVWLRPNNVKGLPFRSPIQQDSKDNGHLQHTLVITPPLQPVLIVAVYPRKIKSEKVDFHHKGEII